MYILQNVSFGNNLRRLRKAKGYKQKDLVSRMQLLGSTMERNTYSMIELGQRNIKVTDLVAIKNVLDVDYSEFFENILPTEN